MARVAERVVVRSSRLSHKGCGGKGGYDVGGQKGGVVGGWVAEMLATI